MLLRRAVLISAALTAMVIPGVFTFYAFGDPPGGGNLDRDCEWEVLAADTGCFYQPPQHWCDNTDCTQYPCPPIGQVETWYPRTGDCNWTTMKSLGCSCVDGVP